MIRSGDLQKNEKPLESRYAIEADSGALANFVP